MDGKIRLIGQSKGYENAWIQFKKYSGGGWVNSRIVRTRGLPCHAIYLILDDTIGDLKQSFSSYMDDYI